MDSKKIYNKLGIAVYLIYYFHHKLHERNTIDNDEWNKLAKNNERLYWEELYDALHIAIECESYLLDKFDSPYYRRYTKEDIKLFFKKLHDFLENWLTED